MGRDQALRIAMDRLASATRDEARDPRTPFGQPRPAFGLDAAC